ncbi:hypothetical protein ACLOJK_037650 [Asimina triloba]
MQVQVGKTMPVGKKDVDGVMEDGSRGGGDADRWRRRRTTETVGRTREEGCGVADGEGEMDVESQIICSKLRRRRRRREEVEDLAMGGRRLDRARVMGRWLARDDGWDKEAMANGTMAGGWLVAGGGGRAGKTHERGEESGTRGRWLGQQRRGNRVLAFANAI